jgi:hypothetical protein
MKFTQIVIGTVTLMVLGTAVPACPQQDQRDQSQSPQQEKPKAAPAEKPGSEKAAPQPQPRKEGQAAPPQEERRTQDDNRARQEEERRNQDNAKPAQQQPQMQQQREQQQRAPMQEQPQVRREDRGHAGHPHGHIPDDRFRVVFGREHHFHISQPVIVENVPRFQYGGYWFELAQPWPAQWAYTDDFYVDYIDDDYYMFDPRYPGMRVLVFVVE